MALQRGAEVSAAGFFLSFQQVLYIHRQCAGGPKPGFAGFDVREQLAFVVARAPRVKIFATDAGIEGRAGPCIQGLRRLDIVMAVYEDGRTSRRTTPACMHDRRTGCVKETHVLQSHVAKVRRKPGRPSAHTVRSGRVPHTPNPHQVPELDPASPPTPPTLP